MLSLPLSICCLDDYKKNIFYLFVLELQLRADLVETTECVVSCLQQPVVTSPFSPINSSSARQSLHTRSTTNALQLPSNVSALGWKLNLIPQWYAGIMNWVSCLWATGAALKHMWGSVTQGIGRWLRGEVNMSRDLDLMFQACRGTRLNPFAGLWEADPSLWVFTMVWASSTLS